PPAVSFWRYPLGLNREVSSLPSLFAVPVSIAVCAYGPDLAKARKSNRHGIDLPAVGDIDSIVTVRHSVEREDRYASRIERDAGCSGDCAKPVSVRVEASRCLLYAIRLRIRRRRCNSGGPEAHARREVLDGADATNQAGVAKVADNLPAAIRVIPDVDMKSIYVVSAQVDVQAGAREVRCRH